MKEKKISTIVYSKIIVSILGAFDGSASGACWLVGFLTQAQLGVDWMTGTERDEQVCELK